MRFVIIFIEGCYIDKIIIKGARENNLKNIDLELPKNKLIVMTGVSGSGKSSLAFDTIYAEGKRRYIDSLSAYARQFLGGTDKPKVDSIEGLSPSISIDQKTTNNNPRSTVGTVTEIYDYLRLLFARIGVPYCPNHHKPITSQSIEEMTKQIEKLEIGTKIRVLAPIIHGEKGTHKDLLSNPLLLKNMSTAATAYKMALDTGKPVALIADSDCDGFTSSALLYNYLYDAFPTWVAAHLHILLHDSKQHGLSDHIQFLEEGRLASGKPFLILIPDAGSNDTEQCKKLNELNCSIIVLDHHICDRENPYAFIINNQNSDYPNKELSGVGVTWQFCRYLDELLDKNYADNYLDLVALGNVADMMSLTSIETKHLIQEGLKEDNLHNPFMSYMIDKNSYSIGSQVTPNGIAFYVAPMINAIVRSGTEGEKELIFESMLKSKAFEKIPSTKRGHKPGDMETIVEQAIRVATNVKARQTKAQDAGMELLEKLIDARGLLTHKVLLFLLEPGQIDKNIAGLVANKLMAKYQRPCCILTKIIDSDPNVAPWDDTVEVYSFQGSARGCDKVGVTQFKDICEANIQNR